MRETTIQRGPVTTTVCAGWVGPIQSRRYQAPKYRSVPVQHQRSVEHHRDHYTTYGDDPSLPDAIRSHETSTVWTGRDSWTETENETTYEREFDGYETRTTAWHDLELDDGGTIANYKGHRPHEGERVYLATIAFAGLRLHRTFNAGQWEWNTRASLAWRLFGRDARRIIEADVAQWRDRVWRISPSGLDIALIGARVVDGVARVREDGRVDLVTAAGRITQAQRAECRFEEDDILLALLDPHETRPMALHNPRTGDTWLSARDTRLKGPLDALVERLPAVIAGTAGCVAWRMLSARDLDGYGVAAAIVAAIATVALWRVSDDRIATQTRNALIQRDNVNFALRVMRSKAWICIRALPPLSKRATTTAA